MSWLFYVGLCAFFSCNQCLPCLRGEEERGGTHVIGSCTVMNQSVQLVTNELLIVKDLAA